MKLTTLSTGSKGNCYIVEIDGEALVLDCGVKFKEVQKSLAYDISNVVGATSGHCHKDHDKFSNQFAEYGIPLLRPFAEEKKAARFGKFRVKAFGVPHDGVECYGFYIEHDSEFKMVYATDLEYCEYTFNDLDLIMIECNYDEALIDESRHNFTHQVRGHMSVKTCRDFVATNAHQKCKKVVLIHPSDYVLNKQTALDSIREVFEETVFAEKGQVLELSG